MGYRTEGMQDRGDTGLRSEGMQERQDSGQDRFRRGEMDESIGMQDRRKQS